jgi:hypothetical protein
MSSWNHSCCRETWNSLAWKNPSVGKVTWLRWPTLYCIMHNKCSALPHWRLWAMLQYVIHFFSGHLWALSFCSSDKKKHEVEKKTLSYTDVLWSILPCRDISLEEKVKPQSTNQQLQSRLGSFDCTTYEMAVTQGALLKLLCASKSLRSKHKKLKYETDIGRKKQRMEKLLRPKWIIQKSCFKLVNISRWLQGGQFSHMLVFF